MEILEKLKPLGLLLLRLAIGALFVYHGYPKLFGHTREAMQNFVQMGLPGFSVYIAAVLEFFGGCMLIVGLFTRIAGLLLACEMVAELCMAYHVTLGSLDFKNYQFPLVLATATFALATLGAGMISFDGALFHESRSSSRKAK